MFTKHISDRGLLSRIYNGFQLNKIKTKTLIKKKNLQKIDISTKNTDDGKIVIFKNAH